MRKLDVSVTHKPFGVTAAAFGAEAVRLTIRTRTGEELCVDLSLAAAESLRADLDLALAPASD
jgi:hypothetical protein